MANTDILMLAGLGVLGFFAVKQFSKPIGETLGAVSGAVSGVSSVVQGATGIVSGGLKAVTEMITTSPVTVQAPVTSDGKLDAKKLNIDISTLNIPSVLPSEMKIGTSTSITYPYILDGYEYSINPISGSREKRKINPDRGNAPQSYSDGKPTISINGMSYSQSAYDSIVLGVSSSSGGSSSKSTPTKMSDLKASVVNGTAPKSIIAISNATAGGFGISNAFSAVGKAKDPLFGF